MNMNRENLFSSLFFIVLLVIALIFAYGVGDYQIASPVEEEAPPEEDVAEAPEEPEGEVFTGAAEGYGGELIVEVELIDNEIAAVRVVEHSETEDLADPALNEVPAAIVESQSTDVDVVTGVTVTSEAIMAAAAAALDEASWDPEMAPDEPAEEPEAEVYTGTAEGYGGELVVEVSVADGEITNIDIIEHSETEEIAEPAFEQVPEDIIATQSTDVDVVTEVTVTSEAIMQAVDNALADVDLTEPEAEPEEEPEEEEVEAEERVLTGTAEGYGGELVVEVTVVDGEITSIDIVDHSETEGLAEPAFEQVPEDIIATQSTDVDVVTEVTLTSEAIMEAVDNAVAELDEAEPEEEPEEEEVEAEERVLTGTAEGYGGELVVEVTLRNDEIIEVSVIEHEETEALVEETMEEIPARIVEQQSTDVDVISGVTMTGEAIIEAVESAME